jgi:hypothetical protein
MVISSAADRKKIELLAVPRAALHRAGVAHIGAQPQMVPRPKGTCVATERPTFVRNTARYAKSLLVPASPHVGEVLTPVDFSQARKHEFVRPVTQMTVDSRRYAAVVEGELKMKQEPIGDQHGHAD